MNIRESKLELWIGVFVVALVVGMFKLLDGSHEGSAIHAEDVTYEMPRPKNEVIGEFGLGDREIDRQYVNPFEKKKAEEEATRKAAAVKQAAILAKAGTPTAQGAAAGAAQNARRPMVLMNVVDAAKHGLSGDANHDRPNDQAPEQAAPPVTRAAAGDAAPDDDAKLSPDQWRALLSAQPTKENMKKLVDAYLKHDVDSGTFYQIVEDLMKSTNTEKQQIAFYGLEQVPSSNSFAFVATAGDKVLTTDAEKKMASDYLNSFSSASRRNALLSAIQSSNKVVSLKAAKVVLAGLADYRKNGGTPPQDQEGRGRATTLSTTSGWEKFVVIAKRWVASGDTDLVGQAQSILSYFPSTVASS